MKKTVLISAAVLALGVAAIAADERSIVPQTATANIAMTSLSPRVSTVLHTSDAFDAVHSDKQHPGAARLVLSPTTAKTDACEKANWPYYPADCLERVETSQL
ncbi:hypothetical protein OEG84_22060 [Hoeflea sp. G2-23]|uniref:Uncharacterized protein n=1 Tax=Hoeflea algicola TaxID=2983763 RepID=A0ABT3ZFB3_9HYPH|nr:hypothetical protein [Hoeflea algicola]MCY0150316.1 hypothetical protein [Hoeflea algicola]